MQANAVLTQSLTTHDVYFPAGSQVKNHSDYDIYHLDFGSFWQLSPNIELNGALGIALLHFNYQMASNTLSTSRRFNNASPEIVLGSVYHINMVALPRY